MRFKIDENLPVEVAAMLNEAGHDAMTINEQGMAGELDSTVASVCQSESRAIVTLDLDFSDIRTYSPVDYHGIIVIRPRIQAKPVVLALIGRLLPVLEIEPLQRKLWILQENGLRIRE